MKQLISGSYTKIGTMKRSGEGIVLEIGDIRYYLMKPDYNFLSTGQSTGLVNDAGEEEGCAWLSPVRESKKKELVSSLHGRIYVVNWRKAQRIMNGQVHLANVFEYSIKERDEMRPILSAVQH